MNRSDWRALLHLVAVLCWAAGIATDLRRHRWKAAGLAIASHVAAEIIGGELGGQVA